MFAGNNTIEIAGNLHDSVHSVFRFMQHFIVVRIHRNVGVHIAIPSVHVQCYEQAATQHLLVNGLAFFHHRDKHTTLENAIQVDQRRRGHPLAAHG